MPQWLCCVLILLGYACGIATAFFYYTFSYYTCACCRRRLKGKGHYRNLRGYACVLCGICNDALKDYPQ